MFDKKFVSMAEGVEVEDVKADYKEAKRVGQYKATKNAIYKADNTYLPTSVIQEVTHDRTAVHVSGCCAGGVPVDRLIFEAETSRYPFLFDTRKDVDKMLAVLEMTITNENAENKEWKLG